MDKTPEEILAASHATFEAAKKAIILRCLESDNRSANTVWLRLAKEHPLHPAVQTMLERYPLDNPAALIRQWPYKSKSDPLKLAYSPTEKHLEADRQIVVTKVSGYIKGHWPNVPDHIIRDIVSPHVSPDVCVIWTTAEQIVASVELGPRSCMKSTHGSIPFDRRDREALEAWFDAGQPDHHDGRHQNVQWDFHPYICYDPRFGWAAAVRFSPSAPKTILARAVVHLPSKTFVRSFGRNADTPEERFGVPDNALEAWLKSEGFDHESGWGPGLKLARIDHPSGGESDTGDFLVPYIDGDVDCVRTTVETLVFTIDTSEAYYECNRTDGRASAKEDDDDDLVCCDHCDSYVHMDTTYNVNRHGETVVCTQCYRYEFVEVIVSYNRNNYAILRTDAWPIIDARGIPTGDFVDPDNPPSGYWCSDYHEAYIEKGDAYQHELDWYPRVDGWFDANDCWHHDSVAIVTCDGAHYAETDCWMCAGTGLWYPNNAVCTDAPEPVRINGCLYHPEYYARCNADGELDAEPDTLHYRMTAQAWVLTHEPAVEPDPHPHAEAFKHIEWAALFAAQHHLPFGYTHMPEVLYSPRELITTTATI